MIIPMLPESGASDDAIAFARWLGDQLQRRESMNYMPAVYEGLTFLAKRHGDNILVFIVLPDKSGVVFHPRSGTIEQMPYIEHVTSEFGSYAETKYLPGVKGGWADGETPTANPWAYPLVDSDDSSFLVYKEAGEQLGEFMDSGGNYGNLYWDSSDSGGDYDGLSWRGTPTRHLRLPSNIDIPGLSLFETSSPGMFEDTPFFTTFGTLLYQGGAVLSQAPKYSWPYNNSGVDGRSLILGAMRDEGGIYIVTQNDHKNAPKYIWLFSDGVRKEGSSGQVKTDYLMSHEGVTVLVEKQPTSPGIFIGLWYSNKIENAFNDGGWYLIEEHAYGRNGLPWFGNSSGTEFVCGNGDLLTVDGTITLKTQPVGSYTEDGPYSIVSGGPNNLPEGTKAYDANHLKFTANYTGDIAYEYVLDKLAFASISARVNTSTNNNASSKTVTDVSVLHYYHNESQPINLSVIAYGDILNIGTLLEVVGDGLKGPTKLTVSGFSVEKAGGYYRVTSLGACSPGVKKIGTAYAEDNCGTKTQTYEFLLYGGMWVADPIVYSSSPGCWSAGAGDQEFTVIYGNTKRKYTYTVSFTSKSTPNGECCIAPCAMPYLLPNEWSNAAGVVINQSCIATGDSYCAPTSNYNNCSDAWVTCPGGNLIGKRQSWAVWRYYVEYHWICP